MVGSIYSPKKIVDNIKPECVIFQSMAPMNISNIVFRKVCCQLKIPYVTWVHGGFGATYSLHANDVLDFRFCKNHISYGPFLKDSIADNKCILKKLELAENYNILPVGSPKFDHEIMKKNLNNLATFILNSCKYVTNHEIMNNELIICTKISNIYNLLDDLKKIDDLKFEMLLDITAVDYPQRSKRFELVYILLSLKNHLRIKVKIFLNDNEIVPSISNLYKSAGWYEREVWDMYGISFNGNNDLRRILTDYGFEGYPLRKDFPLTGFVELRYDEGKKKVEYSKVKLTQDYRNFDFLSPWEGGTLPGDEKADN